jgi:Ca2+-binding EF-hand superfamily protein
MAERELTEEEVADLKEAFAMFDINGDGMLQTHRS